MVVLLEHSLCISQVSQERKFAWIHNHTLQRRSTLEILMQGKMLGDIAQMFSQPHRFERHMYTSSTYCDHCSKVLWGLSKTGNQVVSEIQVCGRNPNADRKHPGMIHCRCLTLLVFHCPMTEEDCLDMSITATEQSGVNTDGRIQRYQGDS